MSATIDQLARAIYDAACAWEIGDGMCQGVDWGKLNPQQKQRYYGAAEDVAKEIGLQVICDERGRGAWAVFRYPVPPAP